MYPQFLRLGGTLRECSIRYRRFCRQYRPTRKRRFASKPKTRDHDQSLFTPARRQEARQIRDDSPAQQRPKWVSAVKSPFRGGAPSAVAAVPETTFRSPWLVDPIREHCRRFWRINGLRRGTIDDVPLA
jgi:hypothetical protein